MTFLNEINKYEVLKEEHYMDMCEILKMEEITGQEALCDKKRMGFNCF